MIRQNKTGGRGFDNFSFQKCLLGSPCPEFSMHPINLILFFPLNSQWCLKMPLNLFSQSKKLVVIFDNFLFMFSLQLTIKTCLFYCKPPRFSLLSPHCCFLVLTLVLSELDWTVLTGLSSSCLTPFLQLHYLHKYFTVLWLWNIYIFFPSLLMLRHLASKCESEKSNSLLPGSHKNLQSCSFPIMFFSSPAQLRNTLFFSCPWEQVYINSQKLVTIWSFLTSWVYLHLPVFNSPQAKLTALWLHELSLIFITSYFFHIQFPVPEMPFPIWQISSLPLRLLLKVISLYFPYTLRLSEGFSPCRPLYFEMYLYFWIDCDIQGPLWQRLCFIHLWNSRF